MLADCQEPPRRLQLLKNKAVFQLFAMCRNEGNVCTVKTVKTPQSRTTWESKGTGQRFRIH